jgi:hypothetical protein
MEALILHDPDDWRIEEHLLMEFKHKRISKEDKK